MLADYILSDIDGKGMKLLFFRGGNRTGVVRVSVDSPH